MAMKSLLAVALLLSLIGCTHQYPPADTPISTFRAVGQEPGWLLEIHRDQTLRFLYNYGENEVLAPVTSFSQSGVQYNYLSQSDAGVINIEIVLGACYDSMSGEAFTATAVIRFNKLVYKGCANPVQ
ncbi:MAG TPA: hypothetical protein VIC08_03040 [Cellvibrionaceae bacterium]